MIIYISENERLLNNKYIDQFFIIRKKVFCDLHGWVAADASGREIDHLDSEYNVYILYVDENTDTVLGGVRLSPTTGNTLMHTAWVDMLPDKDDFRSPNIWEATRFCVDPESGISRSENFVNKVCLAIILAVLDFAGENGISSIIAVCEQRFLDCFSAFNAQPDIISKKLERDGCPVACVLWPTDEDYRKSISWARPFLGGTKPIKVLAA